MQCKNWKKVKIGTQTKILKTVFKVLIYVTQIPGGASPLTLLKIPAPVF